MSYFHYQYCLSDFVVAKDYEKEYFTTESDADFYHQVLLRNVTSDDTNQNKKTRGNT